MALEQVLADWASKAAVLRSTHHGHDAELIDQVCRDVRDAAEDFLTWLSEPEAVLHSNHTVSWLRARFPTWEAQGLAERDGRRRRYRLIALPRRQNLDRARDQARLAVRGAA
jgi:hypothetical protein